MDHRNNFDLIRLFAACQVMASHSITHLRLPAETHHILYRLFALFPGVAIFFVISGFLISGSYIHSGKGKLAYFESRALRIYPALWLNLAVIVCVLLPWGNSLRFSPMSGDFWQWLAIAFPFGSDWIADRLVGNVFQGGGFYRFFPSGVLWTIPIEMSFYLLVPIIFARRLRDRGWLGASLLFWGGASLLVFTQWSVSSQVYQIPKYLWFFLMGAAMQVYWPKIRWLLEGRAWFWLPFFVGSALFLGYASGIAFNYRDFSIQNVFLNIMMAVAVVSCAFTLPRLAGVLRGNDLSYGVYLWHMPVICSLAGWGLTGSWWIAAGSAVATLVVAFISWRFVEWPALKLKGALAPIPSRRLDDGAVDQRV